MTLKDIAKKHNLSLILLHGSQVTGKTHSKSDTDIAVMPKNISDFNVFDTYVDFSEYFKSDNIDLVDLSKANPLLLMSIARKNKLLLGSNADLGSFSLKAFHKYSDYLPYLKMESDFVKKTLNSYATN